MSGGQDSLRRTSLAGWFAAPLFPRLPPPFMLLALMTMSGTIAVHTILPALPGAAAQYGVSGGTIQQAVTLFLFGQCLGQLVHGALSDRFGRRPVLLSALALYTACGVLTVLAPNIVVLLVARIGQAVGGCAGSVLGRTIVRDTTAQAGATRRLAALGVVLSAAPAFGPAIGGWITEWFGWHAPFVLLSLFGASSLVWSLLVLPETNRTPTPSLDFGRLLGMYMQLLRSREFCCYMLITAAGTTTMYGFLANSPFIFHDLLHQAPGRMGLYYILMIGGYAVGSTISGRLAGRVRALHMIWAGAASAGIGGAIFTFIWLGGGLGLVPVLLAMFLFLLGCGLINPFSTTAALSLRPALAGTASGLTGFVQFGWGTVVTLLSSLSQSDLLRPVAILLPAASLFIFAATIVALRVPGSMLRR